MTQGDNEHSGGPEIDPLAPSVDYALNHGWSMIPHCECGVPENALIRRDGEFTDLVTLPEIGHALVVRLHGGPTRDQPRAPGIAWFRHRVPVELALRWILINPADNDLLLQWETEQAGGTRR